MSAANRHATCVAFGPYRGVLILGPSGSGKSALGLALIAQGAQLVADDQTLICAVNGALYARAPRTIAGMIEARGTGLLTFCARRSARLALAIDLALPLCARLPTPHEITLDGVALPCLPGSPAQAFPLAIRQYIGTVAFNR